MGSHPDLATETWNVTSGFINPLHVSCPGRLAYELQVFKTYITFMKEPLALNEN